MNPWTVVGWIVLVSIIAVGSFTLFLTARYAARRLARVAAQLWQHYRTRNVPPAPGQVWVQDGRTLYVNRIHDNGRIGIGTAPAGTYSYSHSSWSDSPDEWRERVRSRRLYLLRPAP